MLPQSIQCKTLKRYFDEEKSFILLDIREPEEFEICRIDGSILTPFSELADHLPDFDSKKEYIIYCKKGDLGEAAWLKMKDEGFNHVRYLVGGIMSWADQIETYLERY